jgi:hypothetical protein
LSGWIFIIQTGERNMPRGIPKHREDGANISKMEGVRRALRALGRDAAPKDIQEYLRNEFAIDMDTTMISNYKSSLKSSGKSAIIRKPGVRMSIARPAGGITVEDIRAVKAVVQKLGASKVRQLADVLGK